MANVSDELLNARVLLNVLLCNWCFVLIFKSETLKAISRLIHVFVRHLVLASDPYDLLSGSFLLCGIFPS